MNDIKLISQGSYGCIFKPGFTCSGKIEQNEKYITKVQKKKKTSEKETEIGKKLKKIKNYRKYYAPIIETCEVNLHKITKKQEIEKCNFIDTKKEEVYESNKIAYIGKETLADYYSNNLNNTKQILKSMMEQQIVLLEGLDKLFKQKIIHLDLKCNNIMINAENRPIIIDFGLSFEIKDLEKENYEKIFFVYGPDYSPWCIDIAMICYICNEMGDNWTEEEVSLETIEKVVKEYVKKNTMIKQYFTQEEKEEYTENMIDYFKNKQTIGEKMVLEILEKGETWDNYALNTIYLELFRNLQLHKYKEFHFIQEYEQILKRELKVIPSERKSIKENMRTINQIGNIPEKDYNTFLISLSKSLDNKKIKEEIKKKIYSSQIKQSQEEKNIYRYLLV